MLAVPGDAGDRVAAVGIVEQTVAAFGGPTSSSETPPALRLGTWWTSRSTTGSSCGTNVDGFVHLAQASLPHLVRSRGNLVAVASVSGLSGDWGQAAYNATKHAVIGFVHPLALDSGDRGVRVDAVAPAFTVTDMAASVGTDEAALAPFVERIALGRPGLPEDVAPAVLILASDDAACITGTMLTVDGGPAPRRAGPADPRQREVGSSAEVRRP